MFCINCGKEIDNKSKFCCFCGKEIDTTIDEGVNKTLGEMDEPLFLKQLVGREELEKALRRATKVVEVVSFLLVNTLHAWEREDVLKVAAIVLDGLSNVSHFVFFSYICRLYAHAGAQKRKLTNKIEILW